MPISLIINLDSPTIDALFADFTLGGIGALRDFGSGDSVVPLSLKAAKRVAGVITDDFIAGDTFYVGIGDGLTDPVCSVTLSSASPAIGNLAVNTSGMVALFAATTASQITLEFSVYRQRSSGESLTIYQDYVTIHRAAIDPSTAVPTPSLSFNTFKTIRVAGQSDVVASGLSDVLTFTGSGVTITTNATSKTVTFTAAGGGGTWGSITGTLSNQTDLQNALNAKANAGANTDITSLTFGGQTLLTAVANILHLRNGANPQIFEVFNTYTDASNYEICGTGFAGNEAFLFSLGVGSGQARPIRIEAGGFGWKITTAGHFLTKDNGTQDIGDGAGHDPRNIYAGSVITPSVTAAVSQTYGPSSGVSKTLTLQTTDGAGSAQTVLTLGADKSATFAGPILFSPDNSYDIGAGGANRPRYLFVATAMAIGSATLYGPSLDVVAIGGPNSSFPAIKRNGAAIAFRLADDSADADISCAGLTASGVTTTAGRKRAVSVKTTTYTVTSADDFIEGNHATTPFAISLSATVTPGETHEFKCTGAASVTIDVVGAASKLFTNTALSSFDLTTGDAIKVTGNSAGTFWLVT